ncbi:rhamnogalacturonan acetylesterase [Paraglaciecola sp.]|uniref:rhamnogalacturonan acetylesterase n=1 Tax=Paraglaciecola sp. TaxID=1920173 RepID=UPI00273DF192|nr:rhamnogalacturonan acetylesterase [Paraglaciecola sp.]MDP5030684.1 rhamnogalacturonan acetylesterase [Paraglaciecola sp.]
MMLRAFFSFIFMCLFTTSTVAGSRVFDLGSQASDVDATALTQAVKYNQARGFGFDFNTAAQVIVEPHSVGAQQSLYFSVDLPQGHYQVELTLGSDLAASTNTVKAESRRLMLNQIKVVKGQHITRRFMVDVRSPIISSEKRIALKERERDDVNWDNKLTLEFAAGSAIRRIAITPLADITTMYLAGDSTVTDQDVEPWASWGQLITQYLKPTIVVANYAVSGASLYSFKAEHRLEKILSLVKPGDYVFIQFAHNDEKRRGEGIGPWQSYADLLNEYIERVQAKQAIAVLLTPVQRRFFNADGTLKPTHGDYPAAIRKVATDKQVPLIDLTQLTTELYESWGDESSRQAFVQYPANTFPSQPQALKDNTHFNYFGANEIALCVIKGMLDIRLPLTDYLIDNQQAYSPANPNQFEHWTVPMSPRFVATKPDGS